MADGDEAPEPPPENNASQDPGSTTPAGAGGASSAKKAGRKAAKKSAAKKSATKKSAKKSAAKKATAKKSTAKKSTAKKSATKKAAAKKSAANKAAAKKAGGRKATKKAGKKAAGKAPRKAARPWLEAYPSNVPATYDYPDVPMTRLLDDAAADFPEHTALLFFGRATTYRQLLDQVDRFASALSRLGVGKGDRVGVVLPNSPQHVIAVLAAMRLGAVAAAVDPQTDPDDLAGCLYDADCSVVVCLDPVYPRLAALKDRLPSVRHVVATGLQDALPFPKNVLFPLQRKYEGLYRPVPKDEGVLRLFDLVEQTPPTTPQADVDPGDDVAGLLYTQTRDGGPRGVMFTHRNLVASAFQARLWVPDVQAGGENILALSPLWQPFGLAAGLGVGLLSAATLTLLHEAEAQTALASIDRRKPTLLFLPAALLAEIAEVEDAASHNLSSLRVGLAGPDAVSAEAVATVERLSGGRVRQVYGVPEAPLTHANPVYGAAKRDRIGVPLPDTDCTLRQPDAHANPVSGGGPGALAVAGPQVMKGYWGRPDESAAALVEGWLLTGDLATVDEDGYFALADREPAA